jgi:hypothetical protein
VDAHEAAKKGRSAAPRSPPRQEEAAVALHGKRERAARGEHEVIARYGDEERLSAASIRSSRLSS